jgi:Flp pilus assembly protein TadD
LAYSLILPRGQCGLVFLLVLEICIARVQVYCTQQPVQTHVERFAPQTEKLRSAERRAEARVRKDPSDVKALLDLGLAHLQLREVDAAILDFQRAAAKSPSPAEAQTDLAYALWKGGHLDEALAAARAAILLETGDAVAHRYAGRLLLLIGGDREEAIAHLEKAAQSNPEETDAHFDLVMGYRAAGDAANAWSQLRLLQAEFPEDDPRLLYVQGLLVSDQGRSALAIDLFRRAWNGDPALEEARDALGVELAQARRWGEALEVLAPASKANPHSFRVAFACAMALMNLERLPEAEEEARRAVRLYPSSPEALALLSQIKDRVMSQGGRQP